MIEATKKMAAGLRVDIAVCTFRRRELAETLRSLAAITVPDGTAIRIIVADNDLQPSAEGLVDALRSEIPFGIDYVHCPASNISIGSGSPATSPKRASQGVSSGSSSGSR